MSDQFQEKKIASETGLTVKITEKYKDMGDGTHALVISAAGGGGGGGGASLADTSVVDANGVYWLVRDDGISLTYKNWATGVTGTPTAPVEPVGAGAGNEISTANYNVKTTAANYTVGDVVQRIVVLDLTSVPAVVLNATWVNLTTGLVITTPTMAHLDLIDDQSVTISGTVPVSGPLTDAQLRATAIPVSGTLEITNDVGNAIPVSGNVGVTGSVEIANDSGNAIPTTDANFGAANDAVAIGDTANTGFISLFKRLLQSTTSLLGRFPTALLGGRMAVNANNFSLTFREPFVAFPGTDWTQPVTGTGDIIGVDGNSAGASYLVLSKNPLDLSGGESMIESLVTFSMPLELAVGAHMSQRVVGQELAVEIVSTETAGATPAELTISSIQQATTTLTVSTTTAHGLRAGSRIGIYGVTSNSALNYSELVVATTPSTTQFTCTAGPQGAIPSVTSGPFAQGFVYQRSAMAFSPNGTSMIFENATVTNASFYSKSDNGDPMPVGGTLNGNHSATIASTASTQPVVAFNNYNFRPTSEYRLAQMADRLQWHDVGVDATGQTTARATVSQVLPNNTKTYKIRFRGKNHKSLTAPVAKIVSAAKTGTTTATVITDVAHGLTTGDVVNIFGARDQTNFPNLAVSTAVASVVNATSFTIVWGGAVTATTFSGYVSRVNGGQLQQGAITQAAQSATVASSILTLVGSVAWSGLLVGDYVNLHGCRDNTAGGDMSLDAVYRVRDIQTTSLVLEQIGGTAIAATLGTTNCGGAIIKRTDLRISFVRLFDFDRLRIETLNRPTNDVAGAMPVQVANVPAVTVSSGTITTVTTVTTVGAVTGGGAAEDAAAGTNPVLVGGVVRTARAPVTLVAGDAARATMTTEGSMTVQPGPSVPLIEVTSAARTTTGNSGVISVPTGGGMSGLLAVTAASGTTPTLDLTLEESYDNGTTFQQIWAAPRVTGITTVAIPPMLTAGLRRWVWTIAGTTPSFTFAITANAVPSPCPIARQLFDRTANVLNGTLSTATAAIPFSGCTVAAAKVTLGAATTPASYQWQVSDDNVNFANVGTSTATVANTTTAIMMPAGVCANWARLIVSSAATAQTGTVVALNATS